jgi:hypothetical protein
VSSSENSRSSVAAGNGCGTPAVKRETSAGELVDDLAADPDT